jgi:dTMP kinase
MAQWIQSLGGRFLVFDGPDGSGKSTQFARFAEHCRSAGLAVCEVREPGGTKIGEEIRTVLLDPANTQMSLRCEMMLYMASRSQLIEETIGPALGRGDLVLADRFISSTLAYQGSAGGMDQQEIMAVGRVAVAGHWPDLTVIFDVDGAVAGTRLDPQPDRVELKGANYQQKVRAGYLEQAAANPEKCLVIDAAPDADAVFAAVLDGIAQRFA